MGTEIIKARLSVERLNQMAQTQPERLIAEAEAGYFDRLSEISAHIRQNRERCKIILLAGPSGSGKTTTASKLREQLQGEGIESVYVSLDNFFLNRDDLPLLPDGMPDFESIRTLDMDCLYAFLDSLLRENRAELPIFDFHTGNRSDQRVELRIDQNFVVIIEGIHALNPIITKNHAAGNFCKLYISPKSEFELDGKVILNSRNLRLIRRMVRDYHFRSSDAVNTMKMWKHVVAGEDIYVRPFRTTADFWIDSTHDYEPMIFHHDLLPIASEVPKDSPYYETVMGLKTALDHFYDLDKSVVPAASLLHEFIG